MLRDLVVGNDDEVAGLGAQLRRAPGDLGDTPFELANADPVADLERLLALDREPGEGIAERVLEREADDDRADRGGREQLVFEDERRDEQEDADDDRVLEDRRKRVRHAIRAERIDQRNDEQVDQRSRERELLERAELNVNRAALSE